MPRGGGRSTVGPAIYARPAKLLPSWPRRPRHHTLTRIPSAPAGLSGKFRPGMVACAHNSSITVACTDLRALRGEVSDQRRADPRPAAGNEHRPLLQAGIGGDLDHRSNSPLLRSSQRTRPRCARARPNCAASFALNARPVLQRVAIARAGAITPARRSMAFRPWPSRASMRTAKRKPSPHRRRSQQTAKIDPADAGAADPRDRGHPLGGPVRLGDGRPATRRATGPASLAMICRLMSYRRGRTTSALPLVETSPSWLVPVISSWTAPPASSLPATLPR